MTLWPATSPASLGGTQCPRPKTPTIPKHPRTTTRSNTSSKLRVHDGFSSDYRPTAALTSPAPVYQVTVLLSRDSLAACFPTSPVALQRPSLDLAVLLQWLPSCLPLHARPLLVRLSGTGLAARRQWHRVNSTTSVPHLSWVAPTAGHNLPSPSRSPSCNFPANFSGTPGSPTPTASRSVVRSL